MNQPAAIDENTKLLQVILDCDIRSALFLRFITSTFGEENFFAYITFDQLINDYSEKIFIYAVNNFVLNGSKWAVNLSSAQILAIKNYYDINSTGKIASITRYSPFGQDDKWSSFPVRERGNSLVTNALYASTDNVITRARSGPELHHNTPPVLPPPLPGRQRRSAVSYTEAERPIVSHYQYQSDGKYKDFAKNETHMTVVSTLRAARMEVFMVMKNDSIYPYTKTKGVAYPLSPDREEKLKESLKEMADNGVKRAGKIMANI